MTKLVSKNNDNTSSVGFNNASNGSTNILQLVNNSPTDYLYKWDDKEMFNRQDLPLDKIKGFVDDDGLLQLYYGDKKVVPIATGDEGVVVTPNYNYMLPLTKFIYNRPVYDDNEGVWKIDNNILKTEKDTQSGPGKVSFNGYTFYDNGRFDIHRPYVSNSDYMQERRQFLYNYLPLALAISDYSFKYKINPLGFANRVLREGLVDALNHGKAESYNNKYKLPLMDGNSYSSAFMTTDMGPVYPDFYGLDYVGDWLEKGLLEYPDFPVRVYKHPTENRKTAAVPSTINGLELMAANYKNYEDMFKRNHAGNPHIIEGTQAYYNGSPSFAKKVIENGDYLNKYGTPYINLPSPKVYDTRGKLNNASFGLDGKYLYTYVPYLDFNAKYYIDK